MKDARVGKVLGIKNPLCPECKQYYLRKTAVSWPPYEVWWCKICEAMFEIGRGG